MRKISRFVFAATAVSVVAMASVAGADPFGIVSLGTTGAAVVDHDSITGDDRGGIAVSTARVFYTGDGGTGRFNLADLTSPASGTRFDPLVGNIKTGAVYVFGQGVSPATGNSTVDRLLLVNGTTGALTGGSILLSSPFVLANGSGIFSGSDRIVVHTGSSAYSIALPGGTVTNLGAVDPLPYYPCESYFYWGVAEEMNSDLYVSYRANPGENIVRTRLSTGAVSRVATFTDLSDLCSFTVWPTLNRWYFHHEGNSQFGGTYETIGYANATFASSFPDSDTDGSPNLADNCPADANLDQLDTDQDYLGDVCDPCPNDPDVDGDLACEEDNCPAVSNPLQEDADNDGFGDACDACPGPGTVDSDGDGACNGNDNCYLPNPDQADLDSDSYGDVCDSSDNTVVVSRGFIKVTTAGQVSVVKGKLNQPVAFFDSPDVTDGASFEVYDNAFTYVDKLFSAGECTQTAKSILCEKPDKEASLLIKLGGEAKGRVPFVAKFTNTDGAPPFFLGPLVIRISDVSTSVDREGSAVLCTTTPIRISCK